jgi:uncharacterized protein YfaS (alpha-2-macroglobulin family)
MMKTEYYLNVGYQRVLTFEVPGGGFDWYGRAPANLWLSAYGLQQLTALARVKDIDTGVIERTRNFLNAKQNSDGSWGGSSYHLPSGNPQLVFTAYVVWALAEAGCKDAITQRGCDYLKTHLAEAKGNAYALALIANALLAGDPRDPDGVQLLNELENMRAEKDNLVYWTANGQTASYACGSSATVETTALVVLAMAKAKKSVTVASKAIGFLMQARSSYGTWGSTQATILALKCLVVSEIMNSESGEAKVAININGEQAGSWQLNDQNRDVMQLCDLAAYTKPGVNHLRLEVSGAPNVIYQVVARHYKPWQKAAPEVKATMDFTIAYDRTTLTHRDTIVADARLHYHGAQPTFMVILDLGIPPGFAVDPGDFAELMAGDIVKRYSVTGAQVTLYLGGINPEQVFTFRYHLKAKYPLKAKTPESTAYEYYSPQVRSTAKPVELEVKE